MLAKGLNTWCGIITTKVSWGEQRCVQTQCSWTGKRSGWICTARSNRAESGGVNALQHHKIRAIQVILPQVCALAVVQTSTAATEGVRVDTAPTIALPFLW